jgi:hypothetical protein
MILCGHFNNSAPNAWFAGFVTIIHLKRATATQAAIPLVTFRAIAMFYHAVTLTTEVAMGVIRRHIEPQSLSERYRESFECNYQVGLHNRG